MDTNARDFANDLHVHGAVVIPVMDEESRRWWEQSLYETFDTFPEYRVRGRAVQRVLGGFGAYGNPSSFHDPVIRQFRRKMKRLAIRPVLREFVEIHFAHAVASARRDVHLEALFDRVCVRMQEFRRPTAESWHRDIYDSKEYKLRSLPDTMPDGSQDMMFGGWVNMDHREQHFVALLGTQDDDMRTNSTGGFVKFSEDQIRRFGFNERLARQANKTFGHSLRTDEDGNVVVPPGHALVFYQRLVHSVKAGPQPTTPSLRVFHGFRLTTETSPLFDIDATIENGGVPRIPSGQMAAMFSVNHWSAFNKPTQPYWREWGANVFRPECLFKRKTKSGVTYYTPGSMDDRNKAANKSRSMPSLAEMGLWSTYYAYSTEERAALLPEPLFPDARRSSSRQRT